MAYKDENGRWQPTKDVQFYFHEKSVQIVCPAQAIECHIHNEGQLKELYDVVSYLYHDYYSAGMK